MWPSRVVAEEEALMSNRWQPAIDGLRVVVAGLEEDYERLGRELADAKRTLAAWEQRGAESVSGNGDSLPPVHMPVVTSPRSASPQRALRDVTPKDIRPSGEQGRDKKVSVIEKTLRLIGHEAHFDDIAARARSEFGVDLIKANCVGMLNAKAKAREKFTKSTERGNTYGLIEWTVRPEEKASTSGSIDDLR